MSQNVMVGRRTIVILITSTLLVGQPISAFGQDTSSELPTFVDDAGVWRWTVSGDEVALFGVNYSTPFAFGYRAHGRVGADRRASIDADVAHFARMGLDAFRIHVWDREISDRDGNLLENNHLDLLDYLLARLHERGIRIILTPIAWWPPGYPEPAPASPGFSERFSKEEMSTEPEARLAQVNYLRQFIRHTNPYTGHTYGEDPNVVAVEIFNEPSHPGPPDETTRYINTLSGALRSAGLTKPIFYNISQGYWDAHGRAVCAADIDGVSVQWYPAGLVRNRSLHGNMLPNVDAYPLPFADFPECRDKARMVYEFDPADVPGSHIYPAMARAFRSAGFQWATQFAYDPMAIAYSNTEYQTHFLNLVYAPSRAISFMIAAEAFRSIPRGQEFAPYPESAHFPPFRVSYEEDLSELVSDSLFYHSGETSTAPPDPGSLRRIAGVGRSPVVTYDGTGAYFLDKLDSGAWRLEVYPDAVRIEDPFGRPSLSRHAVRLASVRRNMAVHLPDLGTAFSIEPLDAGNVHAAEAQGGVFTVKPGAYVLSRSDIDGPTLAEERLGRRAGEYFVPAAAESPPIVVHDAPEYFRESIPATLRATAFALPEPDSVALFIRRVGSPGRPRAIPMHHREGFTYETSVPNELLRGGLVSYTLAVYRDGGAHTFPGATPGDPRAWDFTGVDEWTVPVVPALDPLPLFDARRDRDNLLVAAPWEYVPFSTQIVAGSSFDRSALRAEVRDLTVATEHLAIRSSLTPARPRPDVRIADGARLRVTARATQPGTRQFEIALVMQDGTAWGRSVSLEETWREIDVPLSDLERVPLILLPRPYPHFLPYRFSSAASDTGLDLRTLDGLQFGIGIEDVVDPASTNGFEIERVMLIFE